MSNPMFGDLSLDDIDTKFNRGTYRLRLDGVKDMEASTEMGEPERRFKIFNFSISDDTEEIADFDGENVKGVFLNYWPNLTMDQYKDLAANEKKQVRAAAKLYQSLAHAFGASEDDIQNNNVNFDDYVGSFVLAQLYQNKEGDPQVNGTSFTHEKEVEL